MTDLHAPDRNVDRAIQSWLREDRHEDASRVAGAVLDQVETIPQRRATWWPARRTPIMNKVIGFGVAAAAVVVVLLVGAQLLGPTGDGGVGAGSAPTPDPSVAAPTATAEPSVAEPSVSSTPDGFLPEGPFVVTPLVADARTTTVTIPTSGWTSRPEFEALAKGDDADPPEAAMLFWSWPAGTGFYVYGDPCQWKSTKPETPATTVDEIVAALAAQASRDASAPVDVTIGGYAGKAITLHVPNDAPTRAEAFAGCDDETFASYGVAGDAFARYHQGPGQVDEFRILDVDGAIVIIDAMYRPTTPPELIEEMRAIAESATFK